MSRFGRTFPVPHRAPKPVQSQIKTVTGLERGSVKTVNGVPIGQTRNINTLA